MTNKLMQERFVQTCSQIKEEVKQNLLTHLEKKIAEAINAIERTSSEALSLAKKHFAPLGNQISKKTGWAAEVGLEALEMINKKKELLDRKIAQAFRRCRKDIQSVPQRGKKAVRCIKGMYFKASCDRQIAQTNREIEKIDQELLRARRIVLIQLHQVSRVVKKVHGVQLDQTVNESLKRYIDDPSAEKLYQIGDAIRRQVDSKQVDNRTYSVSNMFYERLKSKGLDLQKVAELNALLSKKKALLKTREALRAKKAGLKPSYVLTI